MDIGRINLLWGSIVAETLARLGARYAVLSPGSRSTPLTLALAEHTRIEAIPVLDERSAAFFALGFAQRTRVATILVCTSGTAVANYFPALVEAHYSHIPLLVLTADRPPDLRACAAGQVIDQQKIFGGYPYLYQEIALPSGELESLRYLRQTLIQAWRRSLTPIPGPVHLNFPFKVPLIPEGKSADVPVWSQLNKESFFSCVKPIAEVAPILSASEEVDALMKMMKATQRGLIVVGPAHPKDPLRFVQAVTTLATYSGWPVLADSLSPLRNHANPYLVVYYDKLVHDNSWASQQIPECVLSVGCLPTSNRLRQWLAAQEEVVTWVLSCGVDNCDALHRKARFLSLAVEDLAVRIPLRTRKKPSPYCQRWLKADQSACAATDNVLRDCGFWFEGKVMWLLSRRLPQGTPVFVANSSPVRDMEYFWRKNERRYLPFFNRGANGIDGIVSSALGVAHRGAPTVLVVGDLAFLHDTNALLLHQHFKGGLTIILIQNHGGGIFETLPISGRSDYFEPFFATPQQVNLKKLNAAYGIALHRPKDWDAFVALIKKPFDTGIRVIEIRTHRKQTHPFRKKLLES